ncbi:MAG: VOC family protein [Cyclobacteriaceae bacterium]
MRKLIIGFLVLTPLLSSAQSTAPDDLKASFSAVIVRDIDASKIWYVDFLGFEVVNEVGSDERGFKIVNLKNSTSAIELIELNKALNPADVIPNYTDKTRLLGLFKIGFIVKDFDGWIDHLTNLGMDVSKDVVEDSLTGKRMAVISDPDGNRIQIFEK